MWGLTVLSAVLQIVIFPLANWTFLCWVGFVPLLIAILRGSRDAEGHWTAVSVKQAFLLAYVNGLIFQIGSVYWIYHVMSAYGGLSPIVSVAVLVLMCAILSLIHGAFGALIAFGYSHRLNTRVLVLVPVFWVALERIRGPLMGFAWNQLGTTLVDNFPLSRIATVTGVYGLSFEVMLVNVAFASALLGPRRRRALMLAFCIVLVGLLECGQLVEPPPAALSGTARLVQTNIPLTQEWTPQTYDQTLTDLTKLSVPQPGDLMPGEPLPDLIIWPESPAPFWVNDSRLHQTLSGIAQQTNAYVIAGTLSEVHNGSNENLYNSASLIAPNGDWIGRYDKVHLVPFGEYVPFADLLSFAHKLTKEVGNFIPGTERMAFPVFSYKTGIFICYESVYPGEIREFANNGANLFVNISNDGWFGETAAPEQHLRMVRMRAVENNRWVVRATNTGITASVDPFGRVVRRAQRNVRVAIDVPYGVVSGTTFYTRHGDWFAWLCAIISAGTIVVLFVLTRRLQQL